MAPKDDFDLQIERMERAILQEAPHANVAFDRNTRASIKFQVTDRATGTVLIPARGEWLVSEIADKSDDDLRNLVRQLSAGRIGTGE